jgi:probable HAF family extracellular repeat protein
MLHSKASKVAIFAAVCLAGIGASPSAHAQCMAFQTCATEWSGGKVIDLSTQSEAASINDRGEVVGFSIVGVIHAIEWSDGKVIDLSPPGSYASEATSINDRGQVAGYSLVLGGVGSATEWSGGKIIDLGGLSGFTESAAWGINDRGLAVGYSFVGSVSVPVVPEPSTWAMLLLGFAGLGFAGYRRARAGRVTLPA